MKNAILLSATLGLITQPALAYHVYASYECSNSDLELKYDGPGSNYAYGGYSHFYSKNAENNEKVSFLAVESRYDGTLGETIVDEVLGVIFNFTDSTITSEVTKSIQPGDQCVPFELDYQHTEWTSKKPFRLLVLANKQQANWD